MAETLLGRRVRCFSCSHSFLAGVDTPAQHPRPEDVPNPRPAEGEGRPGPQTQPLCPVCSKPTSWDDATCPHCNEPFESEERFGERSTWFRRDGEAHRGTLIATLGNISLITGGLALCAGGLGALVAIPVGLIALVMANHDLRLMREGLMDPLGRAQTETGRVGAAVGIVIGLFFGFVGLLLFVFRW
jgi:hypothetical protein